MEAVEAAQQMLRQGVRRARLLNRVLGIDLGQCCGGVVAVWLECFPAASLNDLKSLEAQRLGGPVVLSSESLPDGVRELIHRRAAATEAATRLLDLPRDQATPRLQLMQSGELAFLERLDEHYPDVWLFGAGHVGQSLAGVLVQLPLRLRWFDSRPGQFPVAAAEYSTVLPEEELVSTVKEARPGTYFIVMTHDHGLDYQLCRTVLLRADCAWLGLIGSQSKGARFRSRLRRDDFSAQLIERLVCPIGVDGIKSKWPAAIAVAIAAQLMQILSEPSMPRTARSGHTADPCQAGECGSCGREKQTIKGTVVTET